MERALEIKARVPEPKGLLEFETLHSEISYLKSLKEEPHKLEAVMSLGDRIIKACQENDHRTLEDLLSSKGQLPVLCWHTKKAVYTALENFDTEVMKVFVKLNLDLGNEAFKGLLARTCSKSVGDFDKLKEMVKILLAGGMPIDDVEQEGYCTALHFAVLRQDTDLINFLIEQGANLNPVNKFKQVPLNLVENNENETDTEIAQMLRKAGAESKWNSYMDKCLH